MALFGGVEIPGHPDLDNVARLDRLPIPQIRRMQRLGMAIDREYFYSLSSEFHREKIELEKEIESYIPPDRLHEFSTRSAALEEESGDATLNASSADQIRKLLFEILGIGAKRELKKTKDGSRLSTGKKQLELIKEDHPVVQKVLDYRERDKLQTTYCDALPKLARFHPRGDNCPQCGLWHEQDSWRVHGEVATTRTDTGRKAHRKPNLGNIPARTKNGARIRLGFIASPGRSARIRPAKRRDRRTRLLSDDFSQIELRDLAHCSNAASMIQVYHDEKDIHVYTACQAFDKDYDRYAALLAKADLIKAGAPGIFMTAAEKADLDDFKQFCRMPSKNLNFMICIAGGQRILTDRGLVVIEDVTCHDKVWDGIEFVSHEGVIFKGWKKVITYDGLTATPDHKIWTDLGRKTSLEQARRQHSRLAVTGAEGTPIRYTFDHLERDIPKQRRLPSCQSKMLAMCARMRAVGKQYRERRNKDMQVQQQTEVHRSASSSVVRAILSNNPTVREPQKRELPQLRRSRNSPVFQVIAAFCGLYSVQTPAQRLPRRRHWAQGQRRKLRAWKSTTREPYCESQKYKTECLDKLQRQTDRGPRFIQESEGGLPKVQFDQGPYGAAGRPESSMAGDLAESAEGEIYAPVYDILNAGPRRRFTCEGKLVSNCYGSTVIGLLAQLALSGLYWTEDEGNAFIAKWFNEYPEVQAYMELQQYRARRYGLVWDIFGRIRRIPEVRSALSWIRSAGLRQCGNMPIQATSAGQMNLVMGSTEAMLMSMLDEEDVWCWPLMTIHDELITEVEEDYVDGIDDLMQDEFKNVMWDKDRREYRFRVPIGCGSNVMERWSKD